MGFADILGRMGMASASPADCLLGLERNGFISLQGDHMQTSVEGSAGNLRQVFTCMVQMRTAVFGSAACCAGVGDPGLGGMCGACHVTASCLTWKELTGVINPYRWWWLRTLTK